MLIQLNKNIFNIDEIKIKPLTILIGDGKYNIELSELIYANYCKIGFSRLLIYPEGKLKPKDQIKLAKDIARLSHDNYIFLVTNSNYILKEFIFLTRSKDDYFLDENDIVVYKITNMLLIKKLIDF